MEEIKIVKQSENVSESTAEAAAVGEVNSNTSVKVVNSSQSIFPMPIVGTPYKHQREAYRLAFDIFNTTVEKEYGKGAAFLMEMGTGKTLCAIAVAGKLYLQKRISRLLIVTTVTILSVWKQEMQKFAGFNYSLAVIEGKPKTKLKRLRKLNGEGLQIAVISYDSCVSLKDDILSWAPDMIIADESHKIKDGQTKRAMCLHELGDKAKYKLILTGTPIANDPCDIWSQYRFLDKTVFYPNFFRFRRKFFMEVVYTYAKKYVMKEEMEQEYTKRLHSIAYRVRKRDCLDLPPVTETIRTIPLESKAQKMYDSLIHNHYALLPESGGEVSCSIILTLLKRLCQLTGGFMHPDDKTVYEQVSSAKMESLAELIDTAAAENQKVVVFCEHLPEIEAICDLLKGKKIQYSCVRGAVQGRDRAKEVEKFQTDPDVLVFVGQISTAGSGIDLTAASTAIFYSLNYSYTDFDQAKSRIERNGQKNKCNFIYLVAEGTIDERVLEVLQQKKDVCDNLVDVFDKDTFDSFNK